MNRADYLSPGKEKLMGHEVPQRPWEKVAVDLLSQDIARYGSPCQLVSDNGPQFVAAEFQKLTKEWDIEHKLW